MSSDADRAIAIVGVGAVLPDAPNAQTFWQNICNKRYSIREVPADRWSVKDYYNPDPNAPYKTYTTLGGWVEGYEFDWKRFRIPPRVAAAMDEGQQWAVTIADEALADYGHPQRPLNTDRTGVILGTAMGGERHYETTLAISYPEYANELKGVAEFQALSPAQREAILSGWEQSVHGHFPPVTEDTMPGELPNIVSGRVANVFNLRGPSFIADAACASSFAAINSAFEMLTEHHVDAVLSGGVDRNMGAGVFIKFCKIGALSATGSRPFGEGADGFIMGEGSGAFLLKRLSDAERNGDRIYAVIRGVGSSSDGKGKGITAPNPAGQILSLQRAWENAGLDPATATLVEAHGTSTRVGDVAEATTLATVFQGAPRGSIALGSAKSNIGHLKAGAGAAGLLKAAMALYYKKLPPTLNAERPNPNFDFADSPFTLNTELRDWEQPGKFPRRAGVSAYGFGGTNFHLVLEEHVPGMLTSNERTVQASVDIGNATGGINGDATGAVTASHRPPATPSTPAPSSVAKPPLRGIFALGADSPSALKDKLDDAFRQIEAGWTPPVLSPDPAALHATERLFIDFGNHNELLDKATRARKAAGFDNPHAWKALQGQGIFRGSGPKPGKIAFLFPGQGSQYINMGRDLAELEPIIKQVFDEADQVMKPILGRPLTDFIFVDDNDGAAMKQAELGLMQTAITQPAVLTMDTAIYELLAQYGFGPDIVMGHSLGEYGALIAAGIMPFADALEASAARGAEMTKVGIEGADNGWMAAVMAPYDVIMETIDSVDGYVVAANINSYSQCVIGGDSDAVATAIDLFNKNGYRAMRIPVSHAFHTKIVAPSSAPLRRVLDRLRVSEPQLPLVANVTGELYPTTVEGIKDILELQIATPVQWVKGLETLYDEGVRTFVEVGPKRALKGFVDDVLGDREDVWSILTNHPKQGEVPTFNQALCGLYAAGYGARNEGRGATQSTAFVAPQPLTETIVTLKESTLMPQTATATSGSAISGDALLQALQQLVTASSPTTRPSHPFDRNDQPLGSVVITGTGLGLPGADKPIMDPENAMRILRGEQFVDLIPERHRKSMAGKRITRLVKGDDGSGSFEVIDSTSDVIKLAGRGGSFDLAEEYGVPAKLIEALDITTQLAMAAGLDALREAGIPLLQTYRMTTKGTYLPEKWRLPESLRDETGVVFASAFPGSDRMADEFRRFHEWDNLKQQLAMLEDLRQYTTDSDTLLELQRRIGELKEQIDANQYEFDRRFIFRILAMGHSQFAEHIGARGPNTHVNAACASTAQGVAVAEDWIRSGRCRRVIVIGADDVTNDNLMGWIGSGFLSTGAAATDDKVDEAALPFDRRRHGTLLGMGACALVIESEDAVRARGMRGIAEVLNTETANSAFHGTRLDVEHIAGVMERLVSGAERRFGLNRYSIAPQTVFISHETYTPARGGSAAAEVTALRNTFGDAANEVIVCNTKGFTGHPMGAGIEDVIAVKILEHGIVPPVPNYKEADLELGTLNLSRGGRYPVQYALHLAAGFGSQISMTLIRRIPGGQNRFDSGTAYRRWLDDVSGLDNTELEVVKRVLRIVAQGNPGRTPVASTWQYGTGPVVRASAPGTGVAAFQPAPMIVASQAPARPPVSISPSPAAPKVQSTPTQPTPAQPEPVPVVPAPLPTAEPAVQPASPIESVTPAVMESPATVAPDVVETVVNSVVGTVLAVVADKTGYPEDMLDLDLDLEADLGIDTVKQAETFAAVRETFDIPVQDNLSLRNYSTLQSVIDYVYQNRPELRGEGREAGGEVEIVSTSPQPHIPTSLQPYTPVDSEDVVTAKVLAIVADKTGYPGDMLELDLDMEADLGIDTVKQAETFTSIREAFDIPVQESLSLRDYPTLEKVIGFVYEMRPELRGEERTSTSPATGAGGAAEVVPTSPQLHNLTTPQPDTTVDGDSVTTKVLAIVADKTGYPEDMLELDLDMEADLGIDTVKQAETFASVREAFDIPAQESLSLRDYPTLESVIEFVRTMRPELGSEGRTSTSSATVEAGAVETASASSQPHIPTSPADDEDIVTTRVLAIVADKTGYPEDMLELDLDMEADLGIDTVKQAETFASVREAFDIPAQDSLSLHDYPTLESVIEFVRTMRPELASEGRTSTSSATVAEGVVETAPASPQPHIPTIPPPRAVITSIGTLEDADRMPRRVPVPQLRPALDLCKPTGVTLDEGSRVVVMLDRGGVGKALAGRLEKRGVAVLPVEPGVDTDMLKEQLATCLAEGPIQGVYWLAALDVEPAIEAMALEEWRELNRVRVKNLYTTMRALYDAVYPTGTFLVSATRFGGQHGYGETGASAPLGGAVSGFTKAYNVEVGMRDDAGALIKVVDFEVSRKTAEPADLLIAETLFDPGIVEVGYHDGRRFGITLVEKPAADGQPGMDLNEETIFVVTGAAGGITSAIVTDLAIASKGIFYLLDLVDVPDRNDADILLYRSDVEALKSKLIDEARERGERPTPVVIEKQIAAIERNEAALRAIESVEQAGGAAHYFSINLMDGDAVAAVVDEIRQAQGRIDVLLHAGGLLIDRTLPNKEPNQFNLVYDVKADGFFSLIKAAAGMPIGATVSFSSVAGRFGNNGQSDYSSANDLLCKISSSMREWRPETRGIAIDWTAWGEIGMASRGSVPQIMEALGIDMLPPECGVPTIRRELTYGATRGEIVVAGRLGAWMAEKDETGGLDTDKVNAMLVEREHPLAMIGEVKAAKLYGGLVIETTLDPAKQPFLYDHQVEPDVAWLPGVMGTEAMVEAASLLAPGYYVAAVENQRNLGAFKFHRGKPQIMRVTVNILAGEGGDLLAETLLQSIFQPANVELAPQIKDHFAATVRLTLDELERPTVEFAPPATDTLDIQAEEIYALFFHGPAYQVIERAKVEDGRVVSLMANSLLPNAAEADAAELMAPRVIEHMVQAVALWSTKTNGAMALPAGFESASVYRQPSEANGQRLYALTETVDGGEHFDVMMVDESGNVYVTLKGFQTVQLPS